MEALWAKPRINWKHVDGPMLMWAGHVDWLTWSERVRCWLGKDDAETLAQKRWPMRKRYAA